MSEEKEVKLTKREAALLMDAVLGHDHEGWFTTYNLKQVENLPFDKTPTITDEELEKLKQKLYRRMHFAGD